MRIEKIEGNKIRVTLSQEDLDNYHINIKMLRPDSPQLHTFYLKLWSGLSVRLGLILIPGRLL